MIHSPPSLPESNGPAGKSVQTVEAAFIRKWFDNDKKVNRQLLNEWLEEINDSLSFIVSTVTGKIIEKSLIASYKPRNIYNLLGLKAKQIHNDVRILRPQWETECGY